MQQQIENNVILQKLDFIYSQLTLMEDKIIADLPQQQSQKENEVIN